MKFNCGKSKHTKKLEKADRLRNWHWKFAYLPVNIGDNDCRWLEWYQAKYPEVFIGSSHIHADKSTIQLRPKEESE